MTEQESNGNLSYEQAFVELEQILGRLEGETMSLEDSLMLFERGQFLTRYCADLLEKAQLRMQQLQVNSLSEETEDEDA